MLFYFCFGLFLFFILLLSVGRLWVVDKVCATGCMG